MTKTKFLLFKKDLQLKVTGNCQEVKSTYSKSKKANQWSILKIPGYVDPGENLPDAVVREVKEETGINTEFQSVVAFR